MKKLQELMDKEGVKNEDLIQILAEKYAKEMADQDSDQEGFNDYEEEESEEEEVDEFVPLYTEVPKMDECCAAHY